MSLPPFFVEPLPFTVNLAGNERATNPASNLAEFMFSSMTWRSNGTANLFFRFNLTNPPQNPDFIALLGTNAIPNTTRAQVLLYDALNQTGSLLYDSGSPGPLMVAPAPAGPAPYHSFLQFPTAAGARSGQVIITGHTGDFEAMFMVIGSRIGVTRYYEPEWELGPVDQSAFSIGRNGVPEIAQGQVMRRLAFDLNWLTEAEAETTVGPLVQRLGKTKPIYCAFDPDATSYRNNRTVFGTMADVSSPRKRVGNFWTKRFEILSKI